MTHTTEEWVLVYVLPNLIFSKTFETEFIAIVPFTDKRLRAIRSINPSVKTLLTNFKTITGNKVNPCALIWRNDSPDSIKHGEAVIAFRNILAISCLLKCCSVSVTSDNVYGTVFSDYFDFYPATIGKKGSFHIESPALLAYGPKLEKFSGTTYPYIPNHKLYEAEQDKFIAKKLLVEWAKRYVSPAKDTWKTRLLFRSLEVAYQAMVTPVRNNSSLYEYGTHLSLWVSAFEILVHNRPGDNVGWKNVVELLGQHRWGLNRLDDRRYNVNRSKQTSIKGNLVQKLYKELYNARCDFLHGNQVDVSRLYPFHKKTRPTLAELAPTIYWTALSSFLPVLFKDDDRSEEAVFTGVAESFNDSSYIAALLASIGATEEEEYRKKKERRRRRTQNA